MPLSSSSALGLESLVDFSLFETPSRSLFLLDLYGWFFFLVSLGTKNGLLKRGFGFQVHVCHFGFGRTGQESEIELKVTVYKSLSAWVFWVRMTEGVTRFFKVSSRG